MPLNCCKFLSMLGTHGHWAIRFFGVPYLLWHGISIYIGHLRRHVILTPITERLVVELSLPFLRIGSVMAGSTSGTNALTHRTTAAVDYLSLRLNTYWAIISNKGFNVRKYNQCCSFSFALSYSRVTWLKYCRYDVKLDPINQSINQSTKKYQYVKNVRINFNFISNRFRYMICQFSNEPTTFTDHQWKNRKKSLRILVPVIKIIRIFGQVYF